MIAVAPRRAAATRALDAFVDDATRAYRAQAAGADSAPARARAEAALVLLTDYRLHDIDEGAFEALLARLAAGRSPVRLLSASPSAVAGDLAARWRAHRTATALAHA
jgi:hypothetical protein